MMSRLACCGLAAFAGLAVGVLGGCPHCPDGPMPVQEGTYAVEASAGEPDSAPAYELSGDRLSFDYSPNVGRYRATYQVVVRTAVDRRGEP